MLHLTKVETTAQGTEALKTLGENFWNIELLNFVEIFKYLTLTFTSRCIQCFWTSWVEVIYNSYFLTFFVYIHTFFYMHVT